MTHCGTGSGPRSSHDHRPEPHEKGHQNPRQGVPWHVTARAFVSLDTGGRDMSRQGAGRAGGLRSFGGWRDKERCEPDLIDCRINVSSVVPRLSGSGGHGAFNGQ